MILKYQENNFSQKNDKQEISPFLSLSSFSVPDYMANSAWIEHAPFAAWLVSVMSPNIFVELGVHYGYSYFVFCQAVHQLKLSTQCYAIDNWQGDEHSGFYGEEVFATVNAYNYQKYSGFSQLIRSTFDDAIAYFLDKSIDILHIDGRHFYEDIKHDFEIWLPKLSARAIVLIHDTNVKERNFGVFKFWDELRQRYPHFEFIHGHGLGVLGVGKSIPIQLHALFNANGNNEQSTIRQMYSRLGSALNDHYQLISQNERVNQLTKNEAVLRSDLMTLNEKLRQSEANAFALSEENKKNQLAVLNTKIKNEEEKRKMDVEILQLKNQLSITEAAAKQKEMIIEQLGRTVTQIHSSRFWRFTLPLRKLMQIFS